MIWQTRHSQFTFPRPALIMGILNVTPDSFSDGGHFYSPEAAIAQGLSLIAHGADILDIGGESTRPGAHPVPEAEELRRILPVIEALSNQIQPTPVGRRSVAASIPQNPVNPANLVNPVKKTTPQTNTPPSSPPSSPPAPNKIQTLSNPPPSSDSDSEHRFSLPPSPLLSIDTTKPAVAQAALAAGASIINDISSGNRPDFDMFKIVSDYNAAYILMHIQGAPPTMQLNPQYTNVVAEVGQLFTERLELLARHGVKPEQVALDVGVGFGKTVEHNLQLIAHWSHFTQWNRPLILGVSRKSFLGRLPGNAPAAERLAPSLACASWALTHGHGATIIRCHDIAETRQAARMIEALQTRAATAPANS